MEVSKVKTEQAKAVPGMSFGYGVIRAVEDGKTSAGILVMSAGALSMTGDDAPKERHKAVLVATSGKFAPTLGVIAEHGAQVGDHVIMRPGCAIVEHYTIPDDCRMIRLEDVVGWYRAPENDLQ